MNLLAFDGELAVDAGDDDLVLVVGKGAINHKYIAVIDASTNHRIAAGLGNESRLRTLDQKIVKVQAWLLVVLSGRRKSGTDSKVVDADRCSVMSTSLQGIVICELRLLLLHEYYQFLNSH